MSTTETHHEPTPDEVAHAGIDRGHHPGDVAGEAHGPDDHGDADGHDDHAHGSEALGPIDVERWGALIVGVAAGLLVAACFVITLGLSPAA
jgi:hypothetical protein